MVLLGCAGVVGLWTIYFACVTISIPYPLEYRESASQVMTQYLLEGRNPYGLENQPMAMDSYGIVYSLLVLPLAALFGNTLLIHRVVTLVFQLLCSLLVGLMGFRWSKSAGAAIAFGVLNGMVLGARGGLGAFPSAVGAFFFLSALIVPFLRTFDRRGLVFSALLSLVAFYSKPYFLLSFPIVASYLFIFESKRKAVFHGLVFAVMACASFLLVRALLPVYFIYTIGNNLSNAMRDRPWLYYQLEQLGREFYPSVVLAAILLVAGVLSLEWRTAKPREMLSSSNLLSLERPLVSKPLNYFAYAFGCSALVFVLLLGQNNGSWMLYGYQLMMPPFFLWMASVFKPLSRMALIGIPLLVLNLFLFARARYNPEFLQQRNSMDWARLYAYADSSRHILNTPLIASEMLRLGMWPVDSGRNSFWGLKPYPDNALLGPSYAVVLRAWGGYQDSIQASVMSRQYDRIITVRDTDFFKAHNLRTYYHEVETLDVTMPQTDQVWTVEIWEPNAGGG